MLLSLLAAALQPELPAPPASPAPPQPMFVPGPPTINVSPLVRPSRPTATFDVRVTFGSEQLVSERLRVGQLNATISRSRQEALSGNCTAASTSATQSFNLSLRPEYGSASPDRFRIDVRFSRPVQEGCNGGSRGVTLDQQFSLVSGQTAIFNGDGGLRIELRRD